MTEPRRQGWSSGRRVAALAGVIICVSLAHYLTPVSAHPWHAVFRWFYHLPIIVAAFWFGLRGGAGAAALVTLLYLPHVIFQWGGGTAEQWTEIALYNIVGWVTGFLAQRLREEGDRYRGTAERLDSAYAELRERTRLLLQTEAQLRRAGRLSVLGELTAGLAHEVKTPLASIRGAAEILATEPVSSADREEFSGILLKEVDRLARVVSDFLDFARSGGPDEPAADLAAGVEEVLRLVKVEAGRRGVRLKARLPDDLPAAAIDGEQLKQVILNLVMNSLQAMEGGGRLTVTAGEDGDFVRLEVADDGPGILEEDRSRIFEPFFTTRGEGTGLGLSIVRRILVNHGASIDVRPGAEGGTVAEVRLRRREVRDG